MKKILRALLFFMILLILPGCSDGQKFESRDSFIAHLEGMYRVNDSEYYLFRGGDLFKFNDASFSREMEKVFDALAEEKKFSTLYNLEFAPALELLDLDSVTAAKRENVTIEPKKGTVILDKEKDWETQIVVTAEGIFERDHDEERGALMTKLSEELDLSEAHFAELFQKLKDEYTIPIQLFLPKPETLAESLPVIDPEIAQWELAEKTATTTKYSKHGLASATANTYTYSSDLLLLSLGVKWRNETPFTLLYSPDGVLGQDYQLFIQDNRGTPINFVLQNLLPFLEFIPGALTFSELYDLFYDKYTMTTDNVMRCKETVKGFTYEINYVFQDKAVIFITYPSKIKLSALAGYKPKPESVTIPEIEPEKETVPAPIPTNKVPYTTPLAGSTEIYKEPDSSSKYVQDIGKKGVFTIVKEAYDSSGNLWGKLKSGLGWVLLKKEAVAPARTCSQCGMAEPDTYFADDWQEGDLCDACNYDNFNAGDEKLICKSCGEDCTYIGLEEDGRCEDCHSK